MGSVVNGLTHARDCVLLGGRFAAAGCARATDGAAAAAAGGVLDTGGPINRLFLFLFPPLSRPKELVSNTPPPGRVILVFVPA